MENTPARAKGQIALEYLVTYGWAFLVIFAVIAIMFATGLFSPNAYSTQECAFQPDIPCTSFIFYQTNAGSSQSTITYRLANGLGYKMNVTQVNYTTTDLGTGGRNFISNDYSSTPLWAKSGDSLDMSQHFAGAVQPGFNELRTIYVSFTYWNCKNESSCTGPYRAAGRITAALQPAPATSTPAS